MSRTQYKFLVNKLRVAIENESLTHSQEQASKAMIA